MSHPPPSALQVAVQPDRARVLLTSVCRPMGPEYGDSPTCGYELLHRQVTRSQGIFSPRATHLTFALEYLAANIDAPAAVLHYPSKKELIRELKRGPEYVGVSFVLATFHKMKEVVALVREHAPRAKVVLGGYGTVLDDATLAPFADHVCREEGVRFFRALLGEPPREMPYVHPLIVSRLRVLSAPVSSTGMIFAGLGCPHGCDFCSTSHFFRRKHQRLLQTGDDVFRVIERYLEIDPKMSFTILDEDFLVARDRADRLRELVQARGTPLSIFAFATQKCLSRVSPRELLEMGIDGVWMGYEGARSGFAKQQGKPLSELIPELRSHGISVLSSMIIGFDYQTPEVIREELAGLMALKPTLAQFLIYNPILGTPFHQRVVSEGRLRPDLVADPELYYRSCDGFTAMVRHPSLSAGEIEKLQEECFDTDYRTLGPSVLRSVEVYLAGWKRYHGSDSAYLRAKAEKWRDEIRMAWPVVEASLRFGPNARAAAELRADIVASLGPPSLWRKILAAATPLAAAWTRFTLKHDWFQHPVVPKRTFRLSPWSLRAGQYRDLKVELERALERTRVTLAGAIDRASAKRLVAGIQAHLRSTDQRVEVVIAEGTQAKPRDVRMLGKALARHRGRISVALASAESIFVLLSPWLNVVTHRA